MTGFWKRLRARRSRRAVDAEATTTAVAQVPRADRFGFGDLVLEATTDIGSRPGRLVMTVMGTVLGIGALVATVGFAQTAAGQIARQFDAAAATHLSIGPAEAQARGGQRVATASLPWDAPARLERLAGVESAAVLAPVTLRENSITAVPINDPSIAASAPPALFAASGEILDTLGGHIVTGRSFDEGHDMRGDRVAMLGSRAAERLAINRVDTQPSVFIGGVAYAVVGIFDELDRRAEVVDAVVIPTGAARQDFQLASPGDAIARIVVGTGPQLREQAPLALAPDAVDTLEVSAPQGRSDLARDVQGDVNVVFLILGVIVLLAGGLGIANVTTLSVLERTGEIGLRRALGSTGRQIAGQFVVESIVIGLLGGLIGSALGVFAVLGVSIAQQWSPVLDPWVALGGTVLGAIIGLAAGGIPARRASRIEPVVALRGNA
ncbi:putative ABC transport system permease protein [Microbacterium paludicola]|uniref:ABC transport system permease protein n=1 Tax=Microbacterium paludicola TaxID=300019 RepID=A0ABU1HZ62_9MICO|nr:ABC transporter permease [Microbacterium paludicola]MDR6166916.1 putative ABC transport system permease protein [Microbacterium paludicola]